jgi:hypothetical protein
MTEMIRATEVEALEGYVIRVTFSDGAVKEIDLSEDLAEARGVFVALRDPRIFSEAGINEVGGTVEWPGEIDLDPEVLYGLFEPASGPQRLRAPDLDSVIAAGRSDDLAAVGVDDGERPATGNGLGEDRAESLLVSGDEGGALRITVRVGGRFDQTLVGDFSRAGEFAALLHRLAGLSARSSGSYAAAPAQRRACA